MGLLNRWPNESFTYSGDLQEQERFGTCKPGKLTLSFCGAGAPSGRQLPRAQSPRVTQLITTYIKGEREVSQRHFFKTLPPSQIRTPKSHLRHLLRPFRLSPRYPIAGFLFEPLHAARRPRPLTRLSPLQRSPEEQWPLQPPASGCPVVLSAPEFQHLQQNHVR